MKLTLTYIQHALSTPLTDAEVDAFKYGNEPADELKMRAAIQKLAPYAMYDIRGRDRRELARHIRDIIPDGVTGAAAIEDFVEKFLGAY